jgi:hypothetical protein
LLRALTIPRRENHNSFWFGRDEVTAMANKSIQMYLTSLGFVMVLNNAGCSATGPAANVGSTSAEQQLVDLTRNYETGAIGKDEYERQRAEIQAKRERELVQSGSPLNETVRGILTSPP